LQSTQRRTPRRLAEILRHSDSRQTGSFDSNPDGAWVRRDDLVRTVTRSDRVTGWTFGYSSWSTNWVTTGHIGPARARAITCLARACRRFGNVWSRTACLVSAGLVSATRRGKWPDLLVHQGLHDLAQRRVLVRGVHDQYR
jgi:hypothetical protein